MRNGLEQLARIEAYLLGQLPDTDTFQEEMKNDTALRREVQIVGELIQAVQKQGFQKEIARARTTYRLLRILRWLGIGLAFSLILMAATIINIHKENDRQGLEIRYGLPAENEIGSNDWAQADSVLPSLVYTLRSDRDEVVETPGGTFISIPQGSLRQKNGEPITGTYELEVKEALDASQILKAGLETWSDERLLETGGMFYINMRQKGENLQIPKDAGITASIPKKENRNDMMLFDGIRICNGSGYRSRETYADAEEELSLKDTMRYNRFCRINWGNPRLPISDIITLPMSLLNFYPPGFEAKLTEAGYPDREKAFKDSVYLSFRTFENSTASRENTIGWKLFRSNCARCHNPGSDKLVGPGLQYVRTRWASENQLHAWIHNTSTYLQTGDPYALHLYEKYNKSQMPPFPTLSDADITAILDYIDNENTYYRGINPVSVLAFWNKEFDYSLLASKEFETRMRYIHGTCNERILDCYTKNLDRPLYYCDSLAADLSAGDQREHFREFYYRKQGKSKNNKAFTPALLGIFARKQRELDAAFNRTTGAWYHEQAKADQNATENTINRWTREDSRKIANLTQEYQQNLCNVRKQLGTSCNNNSVFSRNVRENYNTFNLQSTGWKNVDIYVGEATLNRTSMGYTDSVTGKKATLTYSPLTVTINATKPFDITEVYLIPSGKLSFIRLQKKGDIFTESLNGSYTYHLLAIGYQGENVFLYTHENITPGTFLVEPKPSTPGELNRFVSRNGSQRAMDDITYELQGLQQQTAEIKRNTTRVEKEKLRAFLWPTVFPCTAQGDEAFPDPLSFPQEAPL